MGCAHEIGTRAIIAYTADPSQLKSDRFPQSLSETFV